jgi:uncharacterized protein (DUF3820 family)
MNYETFPFGKYKGTSLRDLPSTYIVLALEQFTLPKELNQELRDILLGRLKVYSTFKEILNKRKLNQFVEHLSYYEFIYEREEGIDGRG